MQALVFTCGTFVMINVNLLKLDSFFHKSSSIIKILLETFQNTFSTFYY